MDTNSAVNVIVSTVKSSNLNFLIQESPFSLQITLRKTFIKNKNGTTLQPFRENNNTCEFEQKVQIEKLQQENSALHDSVKHLETDLSETRDTLQKLNKKLENEKAVLSIKSAEEIEKIRIGNETFKHENNELSFYCRFFLSFRK